MTSYISCPVAPAQFSLLGFKVRLQDKGYCLALQLLKLIQCGTLIQWYSAIRPTLHRSH